MIFYHPSSNNPNITEQFARKADSNFDAMAFIIWSNSTLQKESLNSQINIYDSRRNTIGKFDVGISDSFSPIRSFFQHRFKRAVSKRDCN